MRPQVHGIVLLMFLITTGCGGVRAKRQPLIHRVTNSWHGTRQIPTSGSSLFAAQQALECGHRAEGISWSRAIVAYRDAAVAAATALDDLGTTDPTTAIAIHNTAVQQLLRLTWRRGSGLAAAPLLDQLRIQVAATAPQLDPNRIENLEIAADYRISGLTHHYQNEGIGVPIVVRWHNPRAGRRTVQDKYFPEQIVAAGTAVMEPRSTPDQPIRLILHDPFEEPQVNLSSGRSLPLASDRSVAIAVQVERDRSLRGAAFGGALTADLKKYEERLAMLHPHQPGRIPVVFVHGLASSPLIWAETLNELKNDPSLASRFEFWMFLYATGEPIPLSALKLRTALAAARVDFDPAGSDPTLRQMVVVGHSQGGLLTKTLVQDSGLTLWDEVLNIPHPATRLTDEAQNRLDRALIFEHDPGVQRLVFVGTPHRGSPVADQSLVRVVSRFSRPDSSVADDAREIRQAYGREGVEGGLRGDILGLGNLRTASPVLAGLNKIPLSPAVPHHTIALQLPHFNPNDGDGLVPYASSHLDTAASEVIASGFHLNINQPDVTEELRRILHLHLDEAAPASTTPADPISL